MEREREREREREINIVYLITCILSCQDIYIVIMIVIVSPEAIISTLA